MKERGSMKTRLAPALLLLLFLCAGLTGCALNEIQTPSEMIKLEDSRRNYVAMTHDGVVLRARVIAQGDSESVPRGEHDFWVEAIRERMRTAGGYALLEEEEIQSANGHRGTRLKFGRDQGGVPYLYWVVLFVTEDNIHVLDAGGRAERFTAAEAAIDSSLQSYVVRR